MAHGEFSGFGRTIVFYFITIYEYNNVLVPSKSKIKFKKLDFLLNEGMNFLLVFSGIQN